MFIKASAKSTSLMKFFAYFIFLLPWLCQSQSVPSVLTHIQQVNEQAFDLLKTNYDSAVLLADSAYHLAVSSNHYKEAINSLVTKGVSRYYAGYHDEAMQWYMQALKMGDSIDDPASRAKALNEMGVLNRKTGSVEKAETILLQALELSRLCGDSSLMANSMNNLGVVYDVSERYDEAMRYFEESAEIKRRLGDIYGLTYNLDNMGQTMAKQGSYAEGEAYFLEAAKLRLDLGDQVNYAITINNLGELYLMKDDLTRALPYFEKALATAERIDFKDFRLHLYKMLADSYQKQGKSSVAYDYLIRAMQLKDSLFNERRNKQIEELQTKYETEKKEQEIKVLQAETELQALELTHTRNIALAIAVLAAFSILAVALNSSRKRYKMRAEVAAEKEQLQKTRFKAVIDAEENERKRIARELHDGLGQLLSTTRLTVSALDDDEDNPKVQNSLKLIDTAVHEVRNISHNMMPNALAAYGLEVALTDLVRKINLAEKVQVSFTCKTDLPFSESQSIALYRVVQEVLNNALKYSKASEISISISEAEQEITLVIADNGIGFDTSSIHSSSGIGWNNIYSRMELIGGEVSVFSKINEGTSVRLMVPLMYKTESLAS